MSSGREEGEEQQAPAATVGRSKRARRPTAALLAMQEDDELEAAAPSSTGAGQEGDRGGRKSKFAYVSWATRSKPGTRGWHGQLSATRTHPYLKTPAYATDEEAARAVDR